MAEALKTKGIEELSAVRKRVIRQYGKQAISKGDYDKLIKMIDDLEAHIIRMPEDVPARMKKRFF